MPQAPQISPCSSHLVATERTRWKITSQCGIFGTSSHPACIGAKKSTTTTRTLLWAPTFSLACSRNSTQKLVPVWHLVAEDDLTIHFPQIFISASTRVQHVVAQRCALGILPPSLTSLQLSDVSPDFDLTGTQIRDALSAAPALKHLLVHDVSVYDDDVPRLVLPALTSFSFRSSSPAEANFLRIIDLPELLHLVLQVEDHEVFETVSKSLNHGSKTVKVELAITSGCLRCMRSFFRAMPELRWLHITGSDDHVETVIGALVLSSPDLFRSVRRMEFGNQLDKELVVGLCRALASRSSSVGVVSRASNVMEGHVDLQRICMQDGDIVDKYQRVVHGGTWDDEK
ncbi:hypothetical protein R3P38DRAFT_2816481 [Favolaschia claudopus]|uniref:Uncharacterized protein n=1 Tax=Favolaschia claudopus TaxID=2862362 RepID=A0AAV9Z0H2_9AGAR